jgi:hypothetical protein
MRCTKKKVVAVVFVKPGQKVIVVGKKKHRKFKHHHC